MTAAAHPSPCGSTARAASECSYPETRTGAFDFSVATGTGVLGFVSGSAHRASIGSCCEVAADVGQYTQPDPIGLEGGLNLFSYAHGSPVVNTDPDGTRTCVIFTRDRKAGVSFASHMSMVVSGPCGGAGTCSRPTRFLYDPSGGYKPNGGSGRLFTGDEFTMAGYIDYHRSAGSKVELFCYDTSCCEEQSLLKKASELGGGGSFDCATNTSLCLSSLPRFGGMEPSGSPGACRKQLQNLRLQESR